MKGPHSHSLFCIAAKTLPANRWEKRAGAGYVCLIFPFPHPAYKKRRNSESRTLTDIILTSKGKYMNGILCPIKVKPCFGM